MKLKSIAKDRVTVEDFRELFPGQSEATLKKTVTIIMRFFEAIGLAEKNGSGWNIRSDVLKSVDKFEEIRRKIGHEGDLYEFLTELFTKTLRIWKGKSSGGFSRVSEEFGVDENVLLTFLEELLDSIIWKNEDDLFSFVDEIRKGLRPRLSGKVVEMFMRLNSEAVQETADALGVDREEALSVLLNRFLLMVPLSLELWDKVYEVSEGETVEWLVSRLSSEFECVPVNKTLYSSFKKVLSEIPERKRREIEEEFKAGVNGLLHDLTEKARKWKV